MAQKNVKEVAKAGLAELAKRVPPNQSLQFQAFQAKHIEYQTRVNKQPDKLPSIDWDFYRFNVRPESKKWVDEFQQKYKAICDSFDARAKQDYSKYYAELDKVRCELQEEMEKFKCASNERIKALEAEYEQINALKPYDQMTLEEYCDLLPEKKMFMHEGRPSFWPHTLEEQSLEPPMKGHGHDDDHGDDGGHEKPPKGDDGAAGGTATTKGNDDKDAQAKPKTDEKSAQSVEMTNAVQSKGATKQKPFIVRKDAEEVQKKNLANKLIEQEIERALIYAPLDEQHMENKKHQAVIGKK